MGYVFLVLACMVACARASSPARSSSRQMLPVLPCSSSIRSTSSSSPQQPIRSTSLPTLASQDGKLNTLERDWLLVQDKIKYKLKVTKSHDKDLNTYPEHASFSFDAHRQNQVDIRVPSAPLLEKNSRDRTAMAIVRSKEAEIDTINAQVNGTNFCGAENEDASRVVRRIESWQAAKRRTHNLVGVLHHGTLVLSLLALLVQTHKY
jgi:hypothetical protein